MLRASTWLTLVAALMVSAGCNTTTGGTRPDPAGARLVALQIQLGVGYMKDGQNQLAMKRLKHALRLDPASPEAHNAIALLYQRLGENDQASEHFLEALRLNPDFSTAHTNYGSFLCLNGDSEGGEAQFQEAAKNPLYKRRDLALVNAGLCMLRAGDAGKGEDYLRRALDVNPRSGVALLKMAELSLGQKRYLPARAYLERYLAVAPSTAQSLWLGYQIELALGDADTASSYALRLANKFPDSGQARLLEESQKP